MPEPVNNGGNWKETYLPEDLRGDKVFEPIQDVPNLAKAYANLSHLQGKSVKIPDAEAPDQEWDAFHSKIRPESPDKYEIKPTQLPEGLEYDKEMESRFINEVAFKAGLSNRQTQGIIDWWNNMVITLNAEAQKEREETGNALKKEWGRDFDGNTGLAKQAAIKLGGQEYADSFDGLDNGTKKILAQVGKMIGNDKLVSGSSASVSAQEEINKIRQDPKHPFNDPMHPQHKQSIKDVLALYKQGAK